MYEAVGVPGIAVNSRGGVHSGAAALSREPSGSTSARPLGHEYDKAEYEGSHRDGADDDRRQTAVDAGFVDCGVALSATDRPPADRNGEDASNGERERQAPPEQDIAQTGVHGAGHGDDVGADRLQSDQDGLSKV